jgi:NTE family protein
MTWLSTTALEKNKALLLTLIVFSLSACESFKRRDDKSSAETQQVPVALSPNTTQEESAVEFPQTPAGESVSVVTAAPPFRSGDKAKIGVILGPGGLRAYAHIGILQELNKAKIPLFSISGLEMGAVVGAIYASKGQIFDVEWQMLKLKEDEFFRKNLLGSRSPQDANNLDAFLQTSIGPLATEDTKVSFSCPSYNLEKRQIYLMNRGPLTAMLPYCIPYYPFFRPYQQNIAGVTSLFAAAKNLRKRGANYVIYVDLLDDKSTPFFDKLDSSENVTWSTVADSLKIQMISVNKVVSVNLQNFYLSDFDKRREMIQSGQEAGLKLVEDLQKELGL